MRNRRVPSAIVVTAVAVVVGVAFGTATARLQDRVQARYRVYAQALAAIEQGYVEPVDAHCTSAAPCGAEALIYDSIDGMLRTLDPHSSFFTPRDFRSMRERQEGRYFGIGISISPIGGNVVVSGLFEGSPAYRSGIRRGDIIARVGTEQAKNWTTQDVVDRVKGPRGTTVEIGIRRPNVDAEIALTVPRDEIRMPSVRTAFMFDATTGYVRLQDFSETTNTELGAALTKLKGAGMQRLMLDLRDNPGGPLTQAIDVSSRFLKLGQMVVYTRGRIPNSDDDYHVKAQGGFPDVPLVVLVDRQSASASEIVTGSMQDHDRGLVVGETTFGKALVQSVYPISNGAGLALTTGRYYTPSGRLIQRPWDGSFDEYQMYSLRDQDPARAHPASELKYTDHNRKVYGGGGIEPDHFIAGPVEGFNPSRFGRSMMCPGRCDFVTFAERFTREGDDRPGSRSSAEAHKVAAGWTITDAMMEEFRTFLTGRRLVIDEAAFKADEAFIKAMIHFEVDVDLFGVEQARRNLSLVDPQVQAAAGYFEEARQLLTMKKAS